MKRLFTLIVAGVLIPSVAKAHCPLCTVGAGALAMGAAYLGVSSYVVGIFLGAFALALGIWMSRKIKKEYIRYQTPLVTTIIFVMTILPIMPLIAHYTSINIYWFGPYGSLFNRTYMISRFLVGTLIGAGIMLISPRVSLYMSSIKKKRLFPYQGIVITFLLLGIASLIMQFLL